MDNTPKNISNVLGQTQKHSPVSGIGLEELLRQHVIFSITDIKGRIIDVSDAFCSHTGYAQNELIGKRHNILRSDSTEVSLYHSMWSAISDDKNWFGEVQNLKKDGTPFWIKCTITPLFDKDDHKIGYLAIYSNITREKKIEEASYIDELTQIYNRKKFNSSLDSFFEEKNS